MVTLKLDFIGEKIGILFKPVRQYPEWKTWIESQGIDILRESENEKMRVLFLRFSINTL